MRLKFLTWWHETHTQGARVGRYRLKSALCMNIILSNNIVDHSSYIGTYMWLTTGSSGKLFFLEFPQNYPDLQTCHFVWAAIESEDSIWTGAVYELCQQWGTFSSMCSFGITHFKCNQFWVIWLKCPNRSLFQLFWLKQVMSGQVLYLCIAIILLQKFFWQCPIGISAENDLKMCCTERP